MCLGAEKERALLLLVAKHYLRLLFVMTPAEQSVVAPILDSLNFEGSLSIGAILKGTILALVCILMFFLEKGKNLFVPLLLFILGPADVNPVIVLGVQGLVD